MAKTHKVKDLGDGSSEWSDGAVRWNKGNALGKPAGSHVKLPPSMPMLTHETAKLANARRWELARIAAEEGAMEAVREGLAVTVDTPHEAAKYIYKAQATLATSPEEGRASTEAAKMVLSGMDLYADRRSRGNSQPVINIHIDNATLQSIHEIDEDFDVIDVEAEDVPF